MRRIVRGATEVAAAAVLMLLAASAPATSAAVCVGDCDGGGTVTVDELVRGVNIALGSLSVGDCLSFDRDISGGVTVDEVVAAVNNALSSCPEASPLPTNTPAHTATPHPTSTVHLSPTPTRTGTRTRTSTNSPSPTPTLRVTETDAIETAARLAVTNPAAIQIIDFGCIAAHCRRPAAPRQFHLAASSALDRAQQPFDDVMVSVKDPLRSGSEFALAEPVDAQRGVGQWAARGGVTNATALAGPEGCPQGGAREVVCENGTQGVTYADCGELTKSGHSVVRGGVMKLSVLDRDICADPIIRAGDRSRIELLGYSQIERDAGQVVVAQIEASLTDQFDPTREGCAGSEGEQRVDGFIRFLCIENAESAPCPLGGISLSVTARDLVITRRAGGFPCEIGMDLRGGLDVEAHDPTARFVETFDGFLLTETQQQDGSTRIKQNGPLSVECLGALLFATKIQDPQGQTGSFVFPPHAACPVDGVLEVRRPPLVAGGRFTDGTIARVPAQASVGASRIPTGSASDEPANGGLSEAAAQAVTEFRHDLFRSANGKVYQVLQNINSEADLGAEAFQVTTLIGSEAGSVGECANAAGATSDPQAVAAAESGNAFPPTLVFKSELIKFVSQQPCFNRNANGLNGRVCIGLDCVSGSCVCPQGGNCRSFTIGDGTSIVENTSDVPAAKLVQVPELRDPCSGFAGRAAYAFGAGGPTVETRQCDEAPSDGFRLPSGRSIVFAYDTPLAALFNAGFGGFPVDEDGFNLIGCGQGHNRVLHLGHAGLESAPAPIITFLADGRVQFDFDGDGSADTTTSLEQQCRVNVPIACQ